MNKHFSVFRMFIYVQFFMLNLISPAAGDYSSKVFEKYYDKSTQKLTDRNANFAMTINPRGQLTSVGEKFDTLVRAVLNFYVFTDVDANSDYSFKSIGSIKNIFDDAHQAIAKLVKKEDFKGHSFITFVELFYKKTSQYRNVVEFYNGLLADNQTVAKTFNAAWNFVTGTTIDSLAEDLKTNFIKIRSRFFEDLSGAVIAFCDDKKIEGFRQFFSKIENGSRASRIGNALIKDSDSIEMIISGLNEIKNKLDDMERLEAEFSQKKQGLIKNEESIRDDLTQKELVARSSLERGFSAQRPVSSDSFFAGGGSEFEGSISRQDSFPAGQIGQVGEEGSPDAYSSARSSSPRSSLSQDSLSLDDFEVLKDDVEDAAGGANRDPANPLESTSRSSVYKIDDIGPEVVGISLDPISPLLRPSQTGNPIPNVFPSVLSYDSPLAQNPLDLSSAKGRIYSRIDVKGQTAYEDLVKDEASKRNMNVLEEAFERNLLSFNEENNKKNLLKPRENVGSSQTSILAQTPNTNATLQQPSIPNLSPGGAFQQTSVITPVPNPIPTGTSIPSPSGSRSGSPVPAGQLEPLSVAPPRPEDSGSEAGSGDGKNLIQEVNRSLGNQVPSAGRQLELQPQQPRDGEHGRGIPPQLKRGSAATRSIPPVPAPQPRSSRSGTPETISVSSDSSSFPESDSVDSNAPYYRVVSNQYRSPAAPQRPEAIADVNTDFFDLAQKTLRMLSGLSGTLNRFKALGINLDAEYQDLQNLWIDKLFNGLSFENFYQADSSDRSKTPEQIFNDMDSSSGSTSATFQDVVQSLSDVMLGVESGILNKLNRFLSNYPSVQDRFSVGHLQDLPEVLEYFQELSQQGASQPVQQQAQSTIPQSPAQQPAPEPQPVVPSVANASSPQASRVNQSAFQMPIFGAANLQTNVAQPQQQPLSTAPVKLKTPWFDGVRKRLNKLIPGRNTNKVEPVPQDLPLSSVGSLDSIGGGLAAQAPQAAQVAQTASQQVRPQAPDRRVRFDVPSQNNPLQPFELGGTASMAASVFGLRQRPQGQNNNNAQQPVPVIQPAVHPALMNQTFGNTPQAAQPSSQQPATVQLKQVSQNNQPAWDRLRPFGLGPLPHQTMSPRLQASEVSPATLASLNAPIYEEPFVSNLSSQELDEKFNKLCLELDVLDQNIRTNNKWFKDNFKIEFTGTYQNLRVLLRDKRALNFKGLSLDEFYKKIRKTGSSPSELFNNLPSAKQGASFELVVNNFEDRLKKIKAVLVENMNRFAMRFARKNGKIFEDEVVLEDVANFDAVKSKFEVLITEADQKPSIFSRFANIFKRSPSKNQATPAPAKVVESAETSTQTASAEMSVQTDPVEIVSSRPEINVPMEDMQSLKIAPGVNVLQATKVLPAQTNFRRPVRVQHARRVGRPQPTRREFGRTLHGLESSNDGNVRNWIDAQGGKPVMKQKQAFAQTGQLYKKDFGMQAPALSSAQVAQQFAKAVVQKTQNMNKQAIQAIKTIPKNLNQSVEALKRIRHISRVGE